MGATGTGLTWYDLIDLEALEDEEPLPVEAAGVPIALVRVGERTYALHDECTHEDAPLSDGFVEDGCIECPLHQGRFDLASGAAMRLPCTVPVRTYPTRVLDGTVQVGLGA